MFPKFLRIAVAPEYDYINGTWVEKPYILFAKQLKVIASALGFSYEFVYLDGEYSTLLPDGNFAGILGLVQNGGADIAMGAISMTKEKNEALHLSFPLTISELTFVTKKHEHEQNMAVFLHPFSLAAWLSIIACICIMPFTFRCLLRVKHSPLDVLTMTVSSLVRQETPEFTPQKPREYVLLTFWILGSSLLGFFYTAVLLSFITFPSLVGIRTIEDLANGIMDGKYQAIAAEGGYYTAEFLKSSDPSLRVIGNNINETEGIFDFVKEALEERKGSKKPVYIELREDVHLYKEAYFISEDTFFSVPIALAMNKNFCCKAELDRVLHRAWAAGILHKILSEINFWYFAHDYKLHEKNWEKPSSLTALEMQLLKGPFLLLAASHVLAFVVLLIELCIGKFNRVRSVAG